MSDFCLFTDSWSIPKDTANLFGAVRKHDIHTGIDIFMHEDASVHLPFDGVVVKIGNFTGNNAEPTPSPWWNDTQYIIVKHNMRYGQLEQIFVLYGEIEVDKGIKEGDTLTEGSFIGNIVEVLKKDKGRPTSMLHVEIYDECPNAPAVWHLNEAHPSNLYNPFLFLTMCQVKNHVIF